MAYKEESMNNFRLKDFILQDYFRHFVNIKLIKSRSSYFHYSNKYESKAREPTAI